MASLRLGRLSGRHSPDVAMKLTTILTNLTESAGKKDPGTQLPPLRLPVGSGGGQSGGKGARTQGPRTQMP